MVTPRKTGTSPTDAQVAVAPAAVTETRAAIAPPTPRKFDPLNPTHMRAAEYERTVYVVKAPEGCTPQDIIEPGFWAHVAQLFKVWDRLEVRADDGTWYAEAVVVDVSRQWAKIQLLTCVPLTTADVSRSQADVLSLTGAYRIEYKGEFAKWCVIRKKDDAMVHEQENTRDGAFAWLRERLKADK